MSTGFQTLADQNDILASQLEATVDLLNPESGAEGSISLREFTKTTEATPQDFVQNLLETSSHSVQMSHGLADVTAGMDQVVAVDYNERGNEVEAVLAW